MKKNKILVTGSYGFIGSNAVSFFIKNNQNVYGIDIKNIKKDKYFQIDITNKKEIQKIIQKIKPDVIVHTAAMSSLKNCENDKTLAQKINVEATKNIVESIKNHSCKMIFISSDYVFPGTKGNYKENDIADPKTIYGKNKLEAENYIKLNCKDYAICRTANVYGLGGGNFFNFVLDNLNNGNTIDIYKNTFFTPTYILDILNCLLIIINKQLSGVFHLAGHSKESRYSFGKKIAKYFSKNQNLIIPINKPLEDLTLLDSSLNSTKTAKKLNYNFKSTDESLKNTVFFYRKQKPYFIKKDQRGLIYGISQNLVWKEINYIESKIDTVRGNHYHKKAIEGFFIISGEMKIDIFNIKSKIKETFIAKKGNIFVINPYEIHTFTMLKKSSWINMLTVPMDSEKSDIYQKDK